MIPFPGGFVKHFFTNFATIFCMLLSRTVVRSWRIFLATGPGGKTAAGKNRGTNWNLSFRTENCPVPFRAAAGADRTTDRTVTHWLRALPAKFQFIVILSTAEKFLAPQWFVILHIPYAICFLFVYRLLIIGDYHKHKKGGGSREPLPFHLFSTSLLSDERAPFFAGQKTGLFLCASCNYLRILIWFCISICLWRSV